MKTTLFSLILLTAWSSSTGQYTMNTTMEPYQELMNPVSLNNGAIWNEGSYFPLYFNFDFKIYGQTYTALSVRGGGGLNFPGLGFKELFMYHTPFGGYMLKDKGTSYSLSPIDYEIEGDPGQLVLKIQWKNAGFVQWYSTSDTSDFVDFQVWLFEEDNHLEIHSGNSSTDPGTYGYPEATSDPDPGPSIKFEFDTCLNMLCLTGPADLPSYDFYNLCIPNYTFIDGTPSAGITYNIYPLPTGIFPENSPGMVVFPNPATDRIMVTIQSRDIIPDKIKVIDLYGRVCISLEAPCKERPSLSIPLTSLKDGMYIMMISGVGMTPVFRQFIKE
jgi:hypothetical protein